METEDAKNSEINDESVCEFFPETSHTVECDNLKTDLDACFDHYDEYIEIDGVLVNKAEWEKTIEIKKEELANIAEMEAETTESAHGSGVEPISGKNQSKLVKITRKWFKCGRCNYKTKTKSHLTRHEIQFVHLSDDQVEWFECEQCKYRTKRKILLKQHKNCLHTPDDDVQWFECEQCECMSKTKILKQHKNGLIRSNGLIVTSANTNQKQKVVL